MTGIEAAALTLSVLYLADRAAKMALIRRFFARPLSLEPDDWPSISLIQPVTRGATNLSENLVARAALNYPGPLEHIVVCDVADAESQTACHAALPTARILLASPDAPGSAIATKIGKMAAGVTAATGEVLVFVDDDIALPPEALRIMVQYLTISGVGATFGLACQRSWNNLPSSLLSAFVDANALTGYVPLAELTEPYTITGHWFGLTRQTFDRVGGMDGLAGRFDDDHEFARRVRAAGLRIVQTPVVYEVSNYLPTLRAYFTQMRRWFVMPKQAMLPYLTPRERWLTTALSIGNLLPPATLALALLALSVATVAAALLTLVAFLATYSYLEARYLPRRTPAHGLLLLPLVAFLAPVHVLVQLLFPGEVIEWRGQRLRARQGGGLEVLRK